MIDIKKADCMDLMSTMGRGSIDLIVTDPPYLLPSLKGAGIFGKNHSWRENLFEKNLAGIDKGISNECLDEFMRILKKPNLYLWGNWRQILQYIDFFSEYKINSNLLCWHKSNPAPLCSNKFLNDTEYCLFVRGKGVKLYGGYHDHNTYWITKANTEDKDKYQHPTIKPLPIIQQMIENSSQPGDIVFDPFLGSGTTAVACKLTNRNFIGCEIDEKYIPIIHKRLEDVEPKSMGGLDEWL